MKGWRKQTVNSWKEMGKPGEKTRENKADGQVEQVEKTMAETFRTSKKSRANGKQSKEIWKEWEHLNVGIYMENMLVSVK